MVREGDFIGLVAPTDYEAQEALEAIKAEWKPGAWRNPVILAVLFGHTIRPTADWIRRNSRDRVILSKGHAAPALYAAFAEAGIIPRAELTLLYDVMEGAPARHQHLETVRQLGATWFR